MRTGLALVYIVIGFPLAMLWFSLIVAGVAVGFGTIVLWIGLPILVGTILMARGMAVAERGLIHALLGADVPDPYRPTVPGKQRWRTWVTDPASWKDLLYFLVVNPVLSLLWLTLTAILWGAGLGGVSIWYWHRFLPDDRAVLLNFDDDREYLVIDSTHAALPYIPVGVVVLALAYFGTRAFGRAQAACAHGLLGVGTRTKLYWEPRESTG